MREIYVFPVQSMRSSEQALACWSTLRRSAIFSVIVGLHNKGQRHDVRQPNWKQCLLFIYEVRRSQSARYTAPPIPSQPSAESWNAIRNASVGAVAMVYSSQSDGIHFNGEYQWTVVVAKVEDQSKALKFELGSKIYSTSEISLRSKSSDSFPTIGFQSLRQRA